MMNEMFLTHNRHAQKLKHEYCDKTTVKLSIVLAKDQTIAV